MSKKHRKRKKRVLVKPAVLRALMPIGSKFLAIHTSVVQRDASGCEYLAQPNSSLREVVKQNSQEMRCKILTGAQAGDYRTFTWFGTAIFRRKRALWVYSRQDDGRNELVLIIKLLKDESNGSKQSKEENYEN